METGELERIELQRNVLAGVVVVLLATLVTVLSRDGNHVGKSQASASELEQILEAATAQPVRPQRNPVGEMVIGPERAYFAFEVNKQAVSLPGGRGPRFPEALRGKAERGDVLLGFIVDTTGPALMTSVTVFESPHPDFTRASLAALGSYRFAPAEIDGRKVRQWLRLGFHFSGT